MGDALLEERVEVLSGGAIAWIGLKHQLEDVAQFGTGGCTVLPGPALPGGIIENAGVVLAREEGDRHHRQRIQITLGMNLAVLLFGRTVDGVSVKRFE